MTSQPICIFCPTVLDAETTPEHILLNALGGRMTTRSAICSNCNNRFGATIDKALTDQVAPLRNLLQFESGSRKAPPIIKNIQAGEEKLNFRPGGRPERVGPPFEFTTRPDGEFHGYLYGRSTEDYRQALKHLAAKLGMDPSELAAKLQATNLTFVERPVRGISHSLSLGGEDAIRSMTKSCLVLLAVAVGNDVVRSETFKRARDFATIGAPDSYPEFTQIDSRLFPASDELKRHFGEFFTLIYLRSNAAGRVFGYFRLYNIVGWKVLLADRGGPPDLKIGLISDPSAPSRWTDNPNALPDLPLDWFEIVNQEFDFAAPKGRIGEMLAYYIERARAAEVERIVTDVFQRHGIGDTPVDDPVRKNTVINEIAARIASHATRLPFEGELDPASRAALLDDSEDN